MELRDLEYFVVVAEQRRLGRAAEVLGISQPALSKSIARLENALEVKLFKRSHSGMEPTAEGSLLLLRTRELRQSLRNVANEVADLSRGRAGHIKVGIGPSMDSEPVVSSLYQLMRESPRLSLEVVVSDADKIVAELRSGRLDLVVNYLTNEGLPTFLHEPLYNGEFVVCCSATHPLAHQKVVTFADLVDERWAISEANLGSQRKLFDTFRAGGFPPPTIALECRSPELRLGAAANAGLLLFGSRRLIERAIQSGLELSILPVAGLDWRPTVAAIFRNESYLPPAARRLIELLKEAASRPATPTPSNGRATASQI